MILGVSTDAAKTNPYVNLSVGIKINNTSAWEDFFFRDNLKTLLVFKAQGNG